nr:Dam family site-specific DNA-(adenine-N6)-methyltransferase [Rhizobium laguerreae]
MLTWPIDTSRRVEGPPDATLALAGKFAPRPFLRWAGGKTRLLHKIVPFVPNSFRSYHEPFLGSGALFFAVGKRASAEHFLSDLNKQLILTWQFVRDQPQTFYEALKQYEGSDSEEQYYAVRAQEPKSDLECAARFFFLNQTAWNGLWRENRWGVFNVPWGARPFRGIDPATLLSVSALLQRATIQNVDFNQSLAATRRGDFVYLDPPYLPVSDTSKFAGYNGTRFRLDNLRHLAELTKDLDRRGVMWIMSNRDTAIVHDLFEHARIHRFTTKRSVSAQNKRNIQPSDSPEAIMIGVNCGV